MSEYFARIVEDNPSTLAEHVIKQLRLNARDRLLQRNKTLTQHKIPLFCCQSQRKQGEEVAQPSSKIFCYQTKDKSRRRQRLVLN